MYPEWEKVGLLLREKPIRVKSLTRPRPRWKQNTKMWPLLYEVGLINSLWISRKTL